jgi:hypothetical protein
MKLTSTKPRVICLFTNHHPTLQTSPQLVCASIISQKEKNGNSIKITVLLWMGARGIRRFGQLTQSLGKRLKTRADGPKNGPLKAKGLQSSVYKDSILKPHILYPANGFRTGSFNIRLSGRLYSSFGVMNLLYRKQVPETSPCPGRGTGD